MTFAASPRQRFLIGAGAEIIAPDDRLLMVQQERSGQVEWSGTGGTLEPDESVADCAVRETFEETGLRVAIERLIRISEFWDDGHFVGVGFLFLARPDPWPQEVELPHFDGQTRFLDYRWCTRHEVARLGGLWHGHISHTAWPADIQQVTIQRIDSPGPELQA